MENKCCDMGTYKHAIVIVSPFSKKTICIDKCILKEIKYLWSKKIRTGGCCCGHGKLKPCVAVYDESIDKMIELGYEYDPFYLKKGKNFVFLLKGKNYEIY